MSEPKRIVLVSQYYYPYTKSNAKLMRDLAIQMVAMGHQVLVLTPDEALKEPATLTLESGVEVLRIRSQSFNTSSAARRALAEIDMIVKALVAGRKHLKNRKCDLIVWWSPSLFYVFLVHQLRKRWSAPTYMLLRDFIPKWWVDCGIVRKGSLLYRVFRALELWQYRLADTVAIQSPANQKYFVDERLPWVRTEVLWNWSTSEGESVAKTDSRKRLGLEGKTVFFYGGNIGKAQDMDNILRLAEALSGSPQVHFLLVGDGSEVERLQGLIKTRAVSNVTIHPAVGQEEYMGMLSEYDVGLTSLDRGHTTQNFPGKILNYMYFQKPCLASINPGNDLGSLLTSRGAGLVNITGDDKLFVENALRLANDEDLRLTMGINGRKVLEDVFSVKTAAEQVLTHARFSDEQVRVRSRRSPV